jgi:hypothetical protein
LAASLRHARVETGITLVAAKRLRRLASPVDAFQPGFAADEPPGLAHFTRQKTSLTNGSAYLFAYSIIAGQGKATLESVVIAVVAGNLALTCRGTTCGEMRRQTGKS